MKDVIGKIDLYIKQIELQIDVYILEDIFDFIMNLDSKEISSCESKIASLFCRTIEKIQAFDLLNDNIAILIIRAFENIDTMTINNEGTSELKTLYLLKVLYDSRNIHSTDKIANLLSENDTLLDNLEKIQILFTLNDENKNYYFPIRHFLFPIIKSENLLKEIQKTEVLQALMLALSIFNKDQISPEIEEIKKLVTRNNLKFIEYLFDDSVRLFDSDWKENYEYNGTLVLYNKKNSKILIRNNRQDYFNLDEPILELYNFSSLKKEYNSVKNEIGYFKEYSIEEAKFLSFTKEFIQTDEPKKLELLQLIYNDNYINIVMNNSFIKKCNQLLPVNPYSKKDNFCIINNKATECSVNTINQYLRKYSLLKLGGSGLNYVNLGMLIKLYEINPITINESIINSHSSFTSFIEKWLEQCDNKKIAFNTFLKNYTEQLQFTQNKQKLLNEIYRNQFWLPIQIPINTIRLLDFSPVINETSLFQCEIVIENDILNNKWKIKVSKNDEYLDNYEIKEISEEAFVRPGIYAALIDKANKCIYIGQEISLYTQIKRKLDKINDNLLPSSFIESIKEIDIDTIKSYMELFQDALQEIHASIPLDSIVRYRLIFHLLLIYTKDFDFNCWMSLITKHQKVDYSIVKNKPLFRNTDGVLYIPKDRQKKQSTLKFLYNKYFYNSVNREVFELYDQSITKNGNHFCVNGKRIKKICLVFDLIQDGTSSVHTLNYYLNKESEDKDNPQLISFYCGKEKITIKEIINTNKTQQLEIKSFYAGQKGIDALKAIQLPDGISINVEQPLQMLTSVLDEEDNAQIDKIYNQLRGSIKVGDYLVIREFNQPKKNIMKDELMFMDKLIAIFLLRPEI